MVGMLRISGLFRGVVVLESLFLAFEIDKPRLISFNFYTIVVTDVNSPN